MNNCHNDLTHFLPDLSELRNLDPSLRCEYDQAMQAVPERVLEETRFVQFLRADDYDATRAANVRHPRGVQSKTPHVLR